MAYRAARNLAGARAAHEQALRLDPDYATAHANLGTVLRELSRLPEAVACYEQAVRRQPRYAEAHLALGKSLQDLGRLPEALASNEEAVRLQPGLAEAHYHRGEVLEDLGRQDEALAAYREALHCQPDHVEARHQAGQLLEDLGRQEDARQLREELVRTSSTDGAKMRAALATPAVFQTTAHMQRQRQQLEDNLLLLAERQLAPRRPTHPSRAHELLRGLPRPKRPQSAMRTSPPCMPGRRPHFPMSPPTVIVSRVVKRVSPCALVSSPASFTRTRLARSTSG